MTTLKVELPLLVLVVSLFAGCNEPEFPILAPAPILVETFDSPDSTGLYAALVNHRHLSVEDGKGVGGTSALMATYVGSDRGSERIVVEYPLPTRGWTYSLCYDVRFDSDFQFVKGGKIMGLGPDNQITGGHPMTPGGWSARSNFGEDASVRTYLYVQNKPGKWGVAVESREALFTKSRYHAVCLQVDLNVPAEELNGLARIFVDGKLVVDHQRVQYRSVEGDSTLISQILFETFHGGSSSDYAPRDDQGNYATVHAYFDNIAVYPGLYAREPGVVY